MSVKKMCSTMIKYSHKVDDIFDSRLTCEHAVVVAEKVDARLLRQEKKKTEIRLSRRLGVAVARGCFNSDHLLRLDFPQMNLLPFTTSVPFVTALLSPPGAILFLPTLDITSDVVHPSQIK